MKNVGMVQLGHEPGLALEPLDEDLVAHQVFGQNFQSDVAVQADLAGFVNGPHAAGAEGFDQAVLPQLR